MVKSKEAEKSHRSLLSTSTTSTVVAEGVSKAKFLPNNHVVMVVAAVPSAVAKDSPNQYHLAVLFSSAAIAALERMSVCISAVT